MITHSKKTYMVWLVTIKLSVDSGSVLWILFFVKVFALRLRKKD